MKPAGTPLVLAEQEDRRTSSFGADDFQTATDSSGSLAHSHQPVTGATGCRESTSLVRNLDQERSRRKTHLHPTRGGSGVPPDVGQRFTDDLGDHLTMVW